MTARAGNTVAALTVAAAVCGCGGAQPANPVVSAKPASAVGVAPAPALNELALRTGSDIHQISATISAFYRATWQNQGAAACSLFSPTGSSGFLAAAKVAFPSSVNQTTSCAQAMTFFNAGLADSVNTLQQSGVNVSGNVLDNVGVRYVEVRGNTATAQAPVGVEELIKPKLFHLVRVHRRWLISGSQKLGQTLPQILARARAKGQLRDTRSGK